MKEPLQKVLKQLLDEISDQKFADLVFRLFVSMPDTFHKGLACKGRPIPLAEHLILATALALKRVKKWSIGKSKGVVRRVTDETVIACLFHDFWKFDWTKNPPERINGDHGYVSGDKMVEFIKEAKFPTKSKNRIIGSIFYHMGKPERKVISIGKYPLNAMAKHFLSGPDGRTYKIYQEKIRMFNPKKAIKCTQGCK